MGLESKKFESCINLYEQNFYLQKALVVGSESKGLRNLAKKLVCSVEYL